VTTANLINQTSVQLLQHAASVPIGCAGDDLFRLDRRVAREEWPPAPLIQRWPVPVPLLRTTIPKLQLSARSVA
jgi:hypothetical protein